VRRVGVIGMGLMGSGIAQVAASRHIPTVVVDVSEELITGGMERIRESLSRLVESHKKSGGSKGIPEEEKERILGEIRSSTRIDDVMRSDIVIEAIVENEEEKKKIIRGLNEINFGGLVVSNTSSISITRLAAAFQFPEQFMGMHFMNPVPIQPGCELIRGFQTSEETWQRVNVFCRELGKEPICAEDKAGFGINRMFVPFLIEAIKVVEEGIMSCADADKTTLCLGHRMGPITTLDYVGLDTTLAIARVLEEELGPAYKAPDLLRKLVAAGCYGSKNGKGFYLWANGKNIGVNPAVARYQRD
jgi:3-hydroxybutyryl-CoA dehydrogenase